ncbi:MAG TPA: threonine/serine dehydratase [Rhizomicrobium sp.]|nr:threonine/serine dehydratase [Rhizomicrobium sp.]
MSTRLPQFADIEDAARRIAPWAVRTPLIENPALNERAGARVLIKAEPFQRTGSFKFRGACNRILLIPEEERAKGVVAFSSGNHAQGVAAAASLFGIEATIVMPLDAPRAKIEGTRSYGARIVTYDRHTDDREAIARDVQSRTGATLIKPFDDPFIVAGQGTAGLEMTRQARELGVELSEVFVPAGGAGLASGISLAFAHESPATRVIAVEPENYDGLGRSLSAGERKAAPGGQPSLADALLAPMPGEIPFAIAKRNIAAALTVSDEDLARAVSYCVRRLKIVAEPGGTAGLAALLSRRRQSQDGPIGIVLSGGNIDPERLLACCERFPEP